MRPEEGPGVLPQAASSKAANPITVNDTALRAARSGVFHRGQGGAARDGLALC